MPADAEVVEFHRSDPSVLVPLFARLEARGDGEGWVNLGPALPADHFDAIPKRSGLAAWFSGRGPVVPMATWTPSRRDGRPRPAEIGLAHGTGPNALDRLSEEGFGLPDGWTKKQDHAKHGIVAELPAGLGPDRFVPWLLDAMTVLSTVVPTDDYWIAEIHGG